MFVLSWKEGSALVAVDQIYKGGRLRVMCPAGAAELRNSGWYRFDANPQRLRVYRGEAEVALGDSVIKATKGQEVDLSVGFYVGLAISPFNLDDPDPLVAWELEITDERRPLVRLALPASWR